MRKRLTMVITVVLALLLLLTACAPKAPTAPSAPASAPSTPSAPAAAPNTPAKPSTPAKSTPPAGAKVLKYAGHFTRGTPQMDGMYMFADEVNKNTKTAYIDMYEGGALGAALESIESVQRGNVEMGGTTLSNFASYTKIFMPLSLPYLFTGREQAWKFLDSAIGEELKSCILDSQSVYFFMWDENGIRHIFNNKRPIYSPADIKGMKIRVMENPVQMKTIEAMGGLPTPMAMNEQFTALQQGQIDGAENSYPNIYNNKLHEVSKYLSETGHFYEINGEFMNANVWKSLSESDQKVIKDAAKVATDYGRKRCVEEDQKIKDLIKDKVQINSLTPEQIKVFQTATKPVYDWLIAQKYDPWNQKILDAVNSMK